MQTFPYFFSVPVYIKILKRKGALRLFIDSKFFIINRIDKIIIHKIGICSSTSHNAWTGSLSTVSRMSWNLEVLAFCY